MPCSWSGWSSTFVVQLIQGAEVIAQPDDAGAVNTIAILVIVCFLIGIARAYELIGGPSIGISQEVTALLRDHQRSADGSADKEPPGTGRPPAGQSARDDPGPPDEVQPPARTDVEG